MSLDTMVACALDPRTKKMGGIKKGLDRQNVWDEIRNRMLQQQEVVIEAVVIPAAPAVPVNAPAWLQMVDDDDDDDGENNVGGAPDVLVHLIDKEIADFKKERQIEMVEKWDSTDPNTPKAIKYTNPLSWWKTKEPLYPRLAKIARKVLAIPATSAPSERLFSVAGITIANDRARMLPERADKVIMLRENMVRVDAWIADYR